MYYKNDNANGATMLSLTRTLLNSPYIVTLAEQFNIIYSFTVSERTATIIHKAMPSISTYQLLIIVNYSNNIISETKLRVDRNKYNT